MSSKRDKLKRLDTLTVDVLITKMQPEDGEQPSDFVIGQAISYLSKNMEVSEKEKAVDEVAVATRREAKAKLQAKENKARRKAANEE